MGMEQRCSGRQKCGKGGEKMIRISQLKLPITHTKTQLRKKRLDKKDIFDILIKVGLKSREKIRKKQGIISCYCPNKRKKFRIII